MPYTRVDFYFLSYFSAQYPQRYHQTFDESHFRFKHPKGYQTMKRYDDHPVTFI